MWYLATDDALLLQQLCQILNIPSTYVQAEGRSLQVI